MLHVGQNYVEKLTYLEIPGNSRREFEDARFPGIPGNSVALLSTPSEKFWLHSVITYIGIVNGDSILRKRGKKTN